ncbi:iron(III) transport system permease protein [Alkalispirochaeta americana]|uniref:Iron(III) transport system permease protein n=1 Tax=Alkalispirochaeta americana TaxID=159291 RepID=A0A1N6N9Y4_9SPIO|nr:iron ABC transporter permease [Alkalispirochaeta americana]SIP88837.1 iron(III) transport system permease protein [Alkalispirochaeta americana]
MSSQAIARARRRADFAQVLREPVVVITILAIFAMLALFIIYPIYAVFRLSLTQDGAFSTAVYQDLFSRVRYVRSITNSILLGTVVATLATIVGFVFAFAIYRGGIRFRGFFQTMAILPIISPPFMFALSVILLFGRNGLITARLLGLDTSGIYGLPGLVLVQTINLFPIAYLTLSGILQGIDPDVETCAMNLGASRFTVFRTITLPLAKPGILAAWLVVFVSSMTDFGNPIMIGGSFDVLSVQAYLEFTGMGNLPRGAALAVLLLIPTVMVYFLQKYIMGRGSYATITGKSSKRGKPNSSPGLRALLTVFCLGITVIVVLFYGTIIVGSFVRLWGVDWSFTLRHFNYSWDVGLSTLRNTIFLALIATPITALMGTAISFLVMRKRFPGRNAMSLLAMLSYAIPGTAIGIGYVLAFNVAPFRWSGTAFILVTAYVFRHVPIAVESGIAALKQISPEIEESSTNLGASSARTFQNVTLPLIKPAFFAGATFCFVRSMTAISAIIFLVSARWNHVTVLILAQTEIMRLGVASVMSFILILIIMAVIGIMMKLTGLKRDQVFSSGQ